MERAAAHLEATLRAAHAARRSHESLESSVQRLGIPNTEALLSIPTTRGPRQTPISSLPSPAALTAAERSRVQEIPTTGSASCCCLHAGQAAPSEAPQRYASPFRHLAAAQQSPEVNSCSMMSERPQILAVAGGAMPDVPSEPPARPRARPTARAAAAPAAAAEPVLHAFGSAAQPTMARERTVASRKAAPGARPRRRPPQSAAPSAAEPVFTAFGSSAQPAAPRARPPPASRKALPHDADIAAADVAAGSDMERYSRMGDIRVERYGRLAVAAAPAAAAPAAAPAVGGGKVGGLTEEERRATATWLEERRARDKQQAREEARDKKAKEQAKEGQLQKLASLHEVS